jgi:hypothetical protein
MNLDVNVVDSPSLGVAMNKDVLKRQVIDRCDDGKLIVGSRPFERVHFDVGAFPPPQLGSERDMLR